MQAVDVTRIYQKYKGKWVALKNPIQMIVVASGESLKEVLEKARQKGIKQPVMTQIPKQILPIVGTT